MLHDASADIFCIHTCIEINETVSSFLSPVLMFEGKVYNNDDITFFSVH